MLWPSSKSMTTKTTTNRNRPIPNEGGFDPAGSVVFKVVIRAASPPGQALPMEPHSMSGRFPCSVKLYRSSTRRLLPLLSGVVRSKPDLTLEASCGKSQARPIGDLDERVGRISAFIVCRPKKGICIILGHLNADSLRECAAATHIVGPRQTDRDELPRPFPWDIRAWCLRRRFGFKLPFSYFLTTQAAIGPR